ncbi:MAG TPA: hypothetical protein PKA41_01665 [Verrucomicrobiota bacterium]|nr:hypothetical protein [Verrucomicrobiota bacterium]
MQCIHDGRDLRENSGGLGLQQNPDHSNRAEAKLKGDFMAATLIHEDGIGVNLDGQRQCRSLAQIKADSIANGRQQGLR